MTAPGRLGIGVVGGGKVGPVLAAALAGAQHRITGVTTTSHSSRDRIEALLGDVPIRDLADLLSCSDLVILAIPADQISELVQGLATGGHWRAGQLVTHTAARYGSEVLAPATRMGAIGFAIHPAIVFTGTSLDLARLREATCAVTAPAPVLPIAQALAVEIGAEPVIIGEADRPAYAEAIATATDFSSAIVRQSLGLLSGIGVERPTAIIGPLIRASIDAALQRLGEDGPIFGRTFDGGIDQ